MLTGAPDARGQGEPVDADDPDDLLLVDGLLRRAVDDRARALLDVSPELDVVARAVRDRMGGGKRLRAAFCLWASRAMPDGDDALAPGVADAAAALEMFHLGALVHDDVMDRSDLRRGVPTVHRAFADTHRVESWPGDADLYGQSVAILTGDLCLTWSDDLLAAGVAATERAGHGSRGTRARRVWELMRTQTMAGQYLDLHAPNRPQTSADAARVLHFKSAKYTVEHPLLLGATMAGASQAMLDFCSDFGLRVGEAFQLRDDLLGVFGDARQTGKPTSDDVREGKRTVLVAYAEESASSVQLQVLREHLGDARLSDDGLDRVRQVLTDTGARDRVESRIDRLVSSALELLADAPVASPSRASLTGLTEASVWRAA